MATVPIRDILDNETGEPIFPRTHVKAVIGLADSNFFEEYVDGNGARSVKLRSDYVGLWAEGWISNGGIGAGGGGGGGGLINGVYGASSLGSIYSPTGTEDLTKTFSAFAIDKVWQSVLALQQSTPNVSLANGQEYSTISINGASAQFYTKSQVDGLLTGIHSFEPVPVLSLPAASEDTMFKLYLVPSADPQSQNVKDEFITVRSGSAGGYTYSWEQIGSTSIDLSGYATQTWANQQFLKKTGGDISGDIFHQIEEEDVDSGEITIYELWKITENGDATFESLSVDGVDFSTINSRVNTLWNARNNYVTLSGAQTITGAKTFSATITMSGANIFPSASHTCNIGASSAFFAGLYGDTIHAHAFELYSSGSVQAFRLQGGIENAGTANEVYYALLTLHQGTGEGLYITKDTMFGMGTAKDLGKTYARWKGIYGASADLTGNLDLGGVLRVNSFNTIDQSNASMSLFNYGARATKSFNAYGTGINFRACDSNGDQVNILAINATKIQAGSDIIPNYTAGLNLGGSSSTTRWATIYGVDANLSGDLSMTQSSHIDIGPLRIEYDATNKALHITKADSSDTAEYGIYADGFSAAGGVGTQSGSVKYVNCATQSEYNAIANKSASTIYTIGNPVTKIYLGTIQLYTES